MNSHSIGIDPIILILRHRYRYLKRRVHDSKAAYFKTENVNYFWHWIDADLEIISLKEYVERYKIVTGLDIYSKFHRTIKELV